MLKLGAPYPGALLTSDPAPLRDYLQSVENLGYSYISPGDHTLGIDVSRVPDWRPFFGQPPIFTNKTETRECFVVAGFLAALTRKLELEISCVIPRRPTALIAKETAEVDLLTGGRVRLNGIMGWNDLEYQALGSDYATRGARCDEQIPLLRRFWTEPTIDFKGRFHTITAAGLNPLPVQRPIPIWFGGGSKQVLRRVGRLCDGWTPWYPWFDAVRISADLATIRTYAREAGRDPARIGVQGLLLTPDARFGAPPDAPQVRTLAECVTHAQAWERLGATHFSVTLPWAKRDVSSQLTGLRDFAKALR